MLQPWHKKRVLYFMCCETQQLELQVKQCSNQDGSGTKLHLECRVIDVAPLLPYMN